jgi:hypothetical protein
MTTILVRRYLLEGVNLDMLDFWFCLGGVNVAATRNLSI